MTFIDPNSIYIKVTDTYRAVALDSASCCGSDTSCCGSDLYDIDLSSAPAEAISSSRGCGNPQAIAALLPGQVVLDLGSGGGLDCFLAAKQVGATGYVYGVDMTDEMLTLARRNAESIGTTNVEFRKGLIEQLPIADATVDVIISNCVINLSPNKPTAMREAFRVLKPGGRIAFSDVVIDGTLSDLSVDEATIRASLDWSGCIGGALTKTDFTSILQAAGFVDIAITFVQHYVPGDLYGLMPATLHQDLNDAEQAQMSEIIGRFGSAQITAQKPN
jgi:ubiquinone/menaquinone biosynthesis C-methylase UbiE